MAIQAQIVEQIDFIIILYCSDTLPMFIRWLCAAFINLPSWNQSTSNGTLGSALTLHCILATCPRITLVSTGGYLRNTIFGNINTIRARNQYTKYSYHFNSCERQCYLYDLRSNENTQPSCTTNTTCFIGSYARILSTVCRSNFCNQ